MVGNQLGAVTAFCNDPHGNLFGLSAAHVLVGDNNTIASQDIVQIWGHARNWDPCGHVFIRTLVGNSPYPFEFGQVDAGLFTINSTVRQQLQTSLQPLHFSPWLKERDPLRIRNRRVIGYSVMGDLELAGRIDDVLVSFPLGKRTIATDLVIEIESGHTNRGDSGMIWFDPNGYALGLHFAGYPAVNSRKSLATFFHRVVSSFGQLQLSWSWLGTQVQLQQMA